MLDEQDVAALALTSRWVDSAAKPLSAREFWTLRRYTFLFLSVEVPIDRTT
ncbi:hypothetical protein [Mycobacterium paragordonae]|uniref:hypothetical protein n=1 Tax=Mycobacterium paragordonae TaxID=1389713 RepID=UPI0014079B55|nr:hypothetical protein [Mycobacterium paragordonae]